MHRPASSCSRTNSIAAGTLRYAAGQASVFDSPSVTLEGRYGSFVETISRQAFDNVLRTQPNGRLHIARAGALPREVARAVLEVRREHFVAGLQPDRARRDVHTRAGVRDEREAVGVGADIRAERRPGLGEEARKPGAR